jgi:CMP-N,N'-diacetyllegionaminic acid synthase
MKLMAFIPARAGSKRVQGKNTRPLSGHPLIAYTIAAARASGVFSDVIVSTDSSDTAETARRYGASVPFLRPVEFATDGSPDIEWLRHLLQAMKDEGRLPDAFALLRPTSPFRQAATIRRAYEAFSRATWADSLRAVEKCKQHPGKMWVLLGAHMVPLIPIGPQSPPWHSSATQTLPPVFVQNASLEIAWSRTVLEKGSLAGDIVVPFLTEGHEGFDINEPKDWWYAEHLIARSEASLPTVTEKESQ